MRYERPKEATDLIAQAVQAILSLNTEFPNTLQGERWTEQYNMDVFMELSTFLYKVVLLF